MTADVEVEEQSCVGVFDISVRQEVNFCLLWKDKFLKTILNM
jgi:hypothetical protein